MCFRKLKNSLRPRGRLCTFVGILAALRSSAPQAYLTFVISHFLSLFQSCVFEKNELWSWSFRSVFSKSSSFMTTVAVRNKDCTKELLWEFASIAVHNLVSLVFHFQRMSTSLYSTSQKGKRGQTLVVGF